MVHCPVPDFSIKTDCPAVHYNDNLHWLEFRHSKIITYNPDEETSQLHLMNLPKGKKKWAPITPGGFSWTFALLWDDWYMSRTTQFKRTGTFRYDAQEWCLQYRIRFSDSWSDQDELKNFIPKKDNFYIFPLALHPHDFDIVYLGYGGCLVSYSLQTRKLEVVRRNFYSHQLLAFVLLPWPRRIPQPYWQLIQLTSSAGNI